MHTHTQLTYSHTEMHTNNIIIATHCKTARMKSRAVKLSLLAISTSLLKHIFQTHYETTVSGAMLHCSIYIMFFKENHYYYVNTVP